MMRSLRTLVLALLILIIGAFFPKFSLAADKTYFFPSVVIDAAISEDGSVAITEARTFQFNGSFSRVFWDIPLTQSQIIDDVRVSETSAEVIIPYISIPTASSARPPHKFAAERNGAVEHIEAYHSSTNEAKTFTLSYTLKGAVKKYSDVAEFYWKMIGPGWDARTNNVLIRMTLPKDVGKENLYVWGHGPLQGNSAILDGKSVEFTVSNLDKKQMVETRFVFPASIISGPSSSEKNLSTIKAEEDQFRQETLFWHTVAQFTAVGILLGILAWIGFWIVMWVRHGREYDVSVPQYIHTPPSSRPPALVEALMSQNHSISTNSFSATLLDLARRHFIKIEARQKYTKGFLGIGSKRDFDYFIVRGDSRFKTRGSLNSYEQELFDFVFDLAGGDEISFEDLKVEMKNNPATTRAFWLSWTQSVKSEAERQKFLEPDGRKWRLRFIVSNVFIVFLLSILFMILTDIAFMALAIWAVIGGVFLFAFWGRVFYRWTKEASLEAKKWEGFRNFLKDFSHFKDELPQALVIWEEMLVYGTALGVAKQVAKYLPLILGQEKAATYVPTWYHVYTTTGSPVDFTTSVSGLGLDFGTALTQSVSNLTSAVGSSMSSGGGGSFSSSGGGGGGGGGGGAD